MDDKRREAVLLIKQAGKKMEEAEENYQKVVIQNIQFLLPKTWAVVEPHYIACYEKGPFSNEVLELEEKIKEPLEWWYSELHFMYSNPNYTPKDKDWKEDENGRFKAVTEEG